MPQFKVLGEPLATSREIDVGGGVWNIAEEIPVAIVYNRRNYAVMMATPDRLADFAVGFSLTERVVDQFSDIAAVEIRYAERGVELNISIAPEKIERLDIRQQRRNLVGRAGCGLCGLESAEALFEELPRVSSNGARLDRDAAQKALLTFPERQPLNQKTRSVHGAAWVSHAGDILSVREDVGRHNAVDKLFGALTRENADVGAGFCLVSSRCSYEIIEKAARIGVATVVSISAPTAFAIEKAREAGISVYTRYGQEIVEITASPITPTPQA